MIRAGEVPDRLSYDDVLEVGIARALDHIRAQRHLDARFALEVAIRAAERIDAAAGEGGDR